MLYTGEKVCRGSHGQDLMCWDRPTDPPAHTTHSLTVRQAPPTRRHLITQLMNGWRACMETPLSLQVYLYVSQHDEPRFFNLILLMKTNCWCKRLHTNNDFFKIGIVPAMNMAWKRPDQKNSLCGLPTVDTRPTFSWTLLQLGGGAETTAAINNYLTRYPTQYRQLLKRVDLHSLTLLIPLQHLIWLTYSSPNIPFGELFKL